MPTNNDEYLLVRRIYNNAISEHMRQRRLGADAETVAYWQGKKDGIRALMAIMAPTPDERARWERASEGSASTVKLRASQIEILIKQVERAAELLAPLKGKLITADRFLNWVEYTEATRVHTDPPALAALAARAASALARLQRLGTWEQTSADDLSDYQYCQYCSNQTRDMQPGALTHEQWCIVLIVADAKALAEGVGGLVGGELPATPAEIQTGPAPAAAPTLADPAPDAPPSPPFPISAATAPRRLARNRASKRGGVTPP